MFNISLAYVDLIICKSNTGGGGLRLQQQDITLATTAALFQFSVAKLRNSLPLNIYEMHVLHSVQNTRS